MKLSFSRSSFILLLFLIFGCQPESVTTASKDSNKSTSRNSTTTFSAIDRQQSGIQFNNQITETATENYFSYNYFYNGAGVAVGDINNDGLPDLYFSGNQVSNRLYLNKGDFKFEDITESSNTGLSNRWSTGVSMVDINQDGWLDIYVCVAGNTSDPNARRNLLYINQKDGTFTESAAGYKLDDAGYSTQAYFWDYDKDNDLDVYIVNHRVDFSNNSKIDSRIAREILPESSDQLYRNDGGQFVNVTSAAKIANRAWGLSASIADYNGDSWPDIYIANDFLEPDMLYLNQQNGTFKEASKEVFKHISFYGMGSDVADINNDGLMDLYVLDMVSEDHVRSKRNMASMSNDNFRSMVRYGYHHQYMSNTLQLNNGGGSFSEIASMAGVSKSDWSWAPLIADFDGDGWQDIFVTNGIKRDVTDNDFKIKAKNVVESGEELTAQRAFDLMSSAKISNYAFRNNGDLTFGKAQEDWGLDAMLNSNGAMYADLDLDGDLDLVVNNMDAPASIYQNQSSPTKVYTVTLAGPSTNKSGIGATIRLSGEHQTLVRDFYPSRGFMSASAAPMVIPTGETAISTAEVIWSDGKHQVIDIPVNETKLSFDYQNAGSPQNSNVAQTDFQVTKEFTGLGLVHRENNYDDFVKEILLPHRQSQMGPAFCSGDINGDGLDDLVFGGAFGQPREVYVQTETGQFTAIEQEETGTDKEDIDAHLFDADGDGDLDLYFVCGGNEQPPGSPNYEDELLLNDGDGVFTKSNGLPSMRTSGRCVATGDFDGDGDVDLFVGGSSTPQSYPENERSYLLQNNNGKFTDSTPEALKSPGIVNDALWNDIDGDGDLDLIFTGEWMPVQLAINQNGTIESPKAITETSGWYFHLSVHDINADGKSDIVAGNIGLNNKFQPTSKYPLHLYFADFDDNGQKDIVLSKDKGDHELPVRGRECSSQQMPFIIEKFPTYQSFAEADLQEIYGDVLEGAYHLKAEDFAHHVLFQQTDGSFNKAALPNSVQRAPLMDFKKITIDHRDYYLFAGNFYPAEVETIRYDAGIGGLLNYSDGAFVERSASQSGLYLDGDVRHIEQIKLKDGRQLIVAVCNNGGPQLFVSNRR